MINPVQSTVAIAACTLALTGSASAGLITQVVPQQYADTPGTGTFIGPMAIGSRTNQFLIHESLLTNLVGLQLTGVSFRLPASATTDWPGQQITYSNYDIYLSGSVDPADRSFVFAENIVGPQTQVRSGALTIDANAFPSGGSPNDFGVTIGFDNWVYGGGNLLLEIRHTGNGTASRALDALNTSTPGYGTLFSAAWSSNYEAVDGGLQGSFVVMEFTAVPAPGALALLAVAGLGRRRRRA